MSSALYDELAQGSHTELATAGGMSGTMLDVCLDTLDSDLSVARGYKLDGMDDTALALEQVRCERLLGGPAAKRTPDGGTRVQKRLDAICAEIKKRRNSRSKDWLQQVCARPLQGWMCPRPLAHSAICCCRQHRTSWSRRTTRQSQCTSTMIVSRRCRTCGRKHVWGMVLCRSALFVVPE